MTLGRGYFQAVIEVRRRLAAVGLAWGGLLLAAFNLWVGAKYLLEYRFRNDFRLDYAATRLALSQGWSHLYDYTQQRSAVASLGSGFNWQPFISPPPLAWVTLPFTALPFVVALAIWTVLLTAALWGAWWLVAPSGRLARAMHLALLAGFFPTVFGLVVGQPCALVALAVGASWQLERRGHPILAGLALSGLALKPQLALLVPLALLAGGRIRLFGAWLIASLALAAASLLLIGADGFRDWMTGLNAATTWDINRHMTAAGLVGTGPVFYAFQAVIAGLTAAAAWRARHGQSAHLFAIGLVASSLFTPYMGLQDSVMLVVAAWLVVQEWPGLWRSAYLLVGYLLLYAPMVWPTLLLVAWRTGWLATMLVTPRRSSTSCDSPSAEGAGERAGFVGQRQSLEVGDPRL